MTAVLIYGFTIGDFAGEGGQLAVLPWGIVSLVDLYTGFTLFSMWIIYREKSLPAAILWTIAMLTLGFFAGSLYTFIALLILSYLCGTWRLVQLRAPSVEEFRNGAPAPWSGQRRGF
ncbi:MAG: DUF1475 domain-containing protein [Chloroflexi bacterium]|nr:DUF1475 domain-containing protein [Chloroflexota bacterium]